MKWNKLNTVSALILLIVIIFILVSLFLPYNCKTDKTCFDKKAAYCRPASYEYNNDGNLFEYRVLGSSSDNCAINIKLVKDTRRDFGGRERSGDRPAYTPGRDHAA